MPTRIAGLVALLAVLASPVALAQNNVDTVVTNGKILTVDAGHGRRSSTSAARR
jgi:hypothetical protein